MCTATWVMTENGYDLLFNRDVQRTRGIARPPEIRVERGVRYIAPVDTDHGGTWLGVNEFGLAVGLVNHYPAGQAPADEDSDGMMSRGHRVRSLLTCATKEEVLTRCAQEQTGRYRPFILLVIEPGSKAATLTWDGTGAGVVREPVRPPVTTSSFRTLDVIEHRRRFFERMTAGQETISLDLLAAYHASHDPEAGPFSVCLHRPDAKTVSFSHIRVDAGTVLFRYWEGSPCQAEPVRSTSLQRIGRSCRIRETRRVG
ncbi:NRDE family protein [Geobacter sp.]|uniref:NRDE family protein n=1 Tax=Geobacter sp. TaxID=46610 RepID=UPI0027B9EDC2|nr:NRDE family protein [Geobacter sp.]